MKKLDLADVLTTAGLGLVGAGAWMIYPPAALIIVGLLLMALGLFLATKRGDSGHPG